MHKVCPSLTVSAVCILEEVGPKAQLSKGANTSIALAQNGVRSELRSSGSVTVPLATLFADRHNPLLGTVPSTLSQDRVRKKQDVGNIRDWGRHLAR